ncbi:MAG: extracellular solute-binding protein [Anaerolineaceae bacterium]|nr:extracellular solute-binding protein [Anaerolineaceae bacterium]
MKRNKKPDQWFKKILTLFIIVVLAESLSSCDSFQTPDSILGLPIQQSEELTTPTPEMEIEEIIPVEEESAVDEETADSTEDEIGELILWVPPFMDPDSDTEAGKLLSARLESFTNSYEGLSIDVRVKAEEGPADLMASLTSTSAAAPLAMPSLIMLSQSDLELAAKKGLILPVGDYTTVINDLDWFQYARLMAIIGDSAYGLPFAGDALVTLSSTDAYNDSLPTTWSEFFTTRQKVAFEAGDPMAHLILAYYLSLGGALNVEGEGLILESDILTEVLTVFQEGNEAEVFSPELLSVDDAGIIGQFQTGTTDTIITWSTNYLSGNLENAEIHPVIPLTGYNYTIADGWVLAVADPLPERRELAVKLAEFLVDVEFMAEWSHKAGYLPMRSSSLALWPDGESVDTLSLISHSAHIYPDQETMNVIAPILAQSLVEVLEQGIDPGTAAQNAVTALEGIEE